MNVPEITSILFFLVSSRLRRVSANDVGTVSSVSKGILRSNVGSTVFKIQTWIRLDGGHQKPQLWKCEWISSDKMLSSFVLSRSRLPCPRYSKSQKPSANARYAFLPPDWTSMIAWLYPLQTLLAISKFALLASGHHEIRNAEAIKLRLRFIENEENLCQQRLDLLSNVLIITHRRNKETHFSLLLVGRSWTLETAVDHCERYDQGTGSQRHWLGPWEIIEFAL